MTQPAGNEPYPWLTPAWQVLLGRMDSLPHALLLTGPRGIGKLDFGVQLTALLLCEGPVQDGACGQCKSCHLLHAGSHPDLLRISPEEEGKAIKVDQVREINHFAAQTAQLGGYQIILINPADALNINAANALLKNLEEPSGKSLFILITDQPSRLPATIRSRCNQLSLPLPAAEIAHEWLQNRIDDTDKAELLLNLANGAPLLALAYSESDFLPQREGLFKGLTALQRGQATALEVAQQWQSFDPLAVLNWIGLCIEDLIKLSLTGDERQIKNRDHHDFLCATVRQVSVNRLYLYKDRLVEAKRGLLSGSNPNKILLLEDLLMSWSGSVLSESVSS